MHVHWDWLSYQAILKRYVESEVIGSCIASEVHLGTPFKATVEAFAATDNYIGSTPGLDTVVGSTSRAAFARLPHHCRHIAFAVASAPL